MGRRYFITSSKNSWFFCPQRRPTEPITKRFVRKEGGGTTFETLPEGKGDGLEKRGKPGDWEVGPVKAGTLVLIHGNILHKSEKNLSGRSRYIYTFHMIEGEEKYDERNWLQPPEEGFTRLYQEAEKA